MSASCKRDFKLDMRAPIWHLEARYETSDALRHKSAVPLRRGIRFDAAGINDCRLR